MKSSVEIDTIHKGLAMNAINYSFSSDSTCYNSRVVPGITYHALYFLARIVYVPDALLKVI
jgi:hypothetical protein